MKLEITDKSPDLYWAFIHIVSGDKNKEKFNKVLVRQESKQDRKTFDINLTINGEEFNFCDIVTRLIEANDELVNEQAEKLLKQKFEGLNDKIYHINTYLNEIHDKFTGKSEF